MNDHILQLAIFVACQNQIKRYWRHQDSSRMTAALRAVAKHMETKPSPTFKARFTANDNFVGNMR